MKNELNHALFIFAKCPKECPEEHNLSLFENELKKGNESYEDRCKEIGSDILCNIKKHESYLDIDYKELQNLNFLKSDDEEGKAEFSMMNTNLLDLDLKGQS